MLAAGLISYYIKMPVLALLNSRIQLKVIAALNLTILILILLGISKLSLNFSAKTKETAGALRFNPSHAQRALAIDQALKNRKKEYTFTSRSLPLPEIPPETNQIN